MSQDDFQVEPIEGLPERPPEGEQILWQGRPNWFALTRDSLSLYWILGYFGLLAIWRFVTVSDLLPFGQALGATVPFLFLALVVAALLMLFAVVQARATMYTVTNRRVVMRIGAALTLTLNLPYAQIANAMLDLRKSGTGTIAFETLGRTQLSYLVLWPHLRPWYMRPTQPALRCIPDAERVAALIADAAEARVSTPRVALKGSVPGVAVAAE
ncbi:MAG: photosynthetic complex putative assembly protein PuhB [Pseudomonadota bacterium]